MFKAEIGGGWLYIIIAVGLMVLGAIEKYIKKTKEMAQPPAPTDQEEQTGEHAPDIRKTLEDIFKQMQQPTPVSMEEEVEEEAQSLETIPEVPEYIAPQYIPERQYQNTFTKYQPIIAPEPDPIFLTEEELKDNDLEFEFDIREAVIYSEILRRKYE